MKAAFFLQDSRRVPFILEKGGEMRNVSDKSLGPIISCFMAGALLLALPLAAQKDFNQAEKDTIEKYKRARVHFLKGGEYLKKGKLDKARKEAETGLEIFPRYAEARLLLAELAYQRGEYDGALRDIETAKNDFSAFSRLYTYTYQEYLDRLREQRDEKEKVLNMMAAALSNVKSNAERLRIESQVSMAKQDLATIDARLNDPIPPTMDIPAEFHFIHGNILFKLKRYGEAQTFYQATVKTNPRHANACNNLISILFASGDHAGALKCLEQAEANGVAVNEKLKKAILEKK